MGGDFDEDEGGDLEARQFFNSFLSLLSLLPVAVDVVLGVGLPLMMVVVVFNCLVAVIAFVGSALSGLGDGQVSEKRQNFDFCTLKL